MGFSRYVASTMRALPVGADLAASCPSSAASSLPAALAPPQRPPAGTARPRPRWQPTVAVGVAFSVLAAGCGGSDGQPAKAGAASAPARGAKVELPGGRIAFRRYLDVARTHGAIFTVNPDGSDEKQLTQPPVDYVDDHPDWSPDGKRIAFERCAEDEPCTVFTVAADGGKPQKVHARCELRPICDLATSGMDTRRAPPRHARPGTRTPRSRDLRELDPAVRRRAARPRHRPPADDRRAPQLDR